MSRSFKHTPIGGICGCKSEKEDKRILHRKTRARVRTQIAKVYRDEEYEYIEPLPEEVLSVWSMGKDGKSGYWTPTPYNPVKLWPEYPGQSEEDIKKSMRK